MSAAKSKGRPTIAEAGTGQVIAESSAVSQGAAAGERADERSSARPVKDVVVTVRMTAEDADALAFLQAELGAASAPDAAREAIRHITALLRSETYRSGKVQRPVVNADEALLAEIRDALRDVTKSYNERTREVHYVGHNWNQLAKVANATGTVDTDALRGVERALIEIRKQMGADAECDAKALEVLTRLL
jgi:nucleoside phosphorylase